MKNLTIFLLGIVTMFMLSFTQPIQSIIYQPKVPKFTSFCAIEVSSMNKAKELIESLAKQGYIIKDVSIAADTRTRSYYLVTILYERY